MNVTYQAPRKQKKHGNGHQAGHINHSLGAFIMFILILLILATLYLGYRIYIKKKYFYGKESRYTIENDQAEDEIISE